MNIFVLSLNPTKAARALCDKHVPKMVLETAQLLCSPFEPGTAPYKRTHYNHPCAKWVRLEKENYCWLVAYGWAVAEEYAFRFDRTHKSQEVIIWCERHYPDIPLDSMRLEPTPFVQAMPDKYKHRNPVTAYRRYYKGEKARFAKWERGREPPEWWDK